MRRAAHRFLLVTLALALATSAFAASSLKLGTSFPGWERVRSGVTFDTAMGVARRYAGQIGRFCTMPEVFVRTQAPSIPTAVFHYRGYLPYGATERVLRDAFDHRVALISSRALPSGVLSVMATTRSGVALVLC
jgi:hypothetical protein